MNKSFHLAIITKKEKNATITTMSKELESHLDLLDQKIRHGDIKFVQNELDGLELERVPNRYAARIASLARRVSRGSLGVDILYPIVRPRDSKKAKATVKILPSMQLC
jgi:hypothetical protein